MLCLSSRAADALFAGNFPARTSAPIGAASYALTTATTADGLGGCSATTATSWLGTESQSVRFSKALDTFEITPDTIVSIEPAGREDVFDIQVENTENFIANGLVSHNTRWHEDDLAGRLLNSRGAADWTVLNLPALAEQDDILGRKPGEPLWPDWYGLDALEEVRRDLTTEQGSRAWQALYQQRPTADEGGMFRRAWFQQRYHEQDAYTFRVLGVDAAFKTGVQNDYSALVLIGATAERFAVVDVQQGRWEYPDLKRQIIQAAETHRPHAIVIEDTASGQSAIQELRLSTRLPIIPVKVTASKEARAQAVAPMCEAGRVVLPNVSTWSSDLLDELAAFPTGAHDDMVDAFVHAMTYAMRATAGGSGLVIHDLTMGSAMNERRNDSFQRMRLPAPARVR